MSEENKNSKKEKDNKLASKKKVALNNIIIAFCVMVGIIVLVAVAGFFILQPEDEIIMGQAEAEELRISGKVPGRIVRYNFEVGDKVHTGDTLVLIPSPEVAAKLEQAQALRQAADANRERAEKGTSGNTVQTTYELWQKAKANRELAEKTNKRIQKLYKEGVVSAQRRDEAETTLRSMKASEKTAYTQYLRSKETISDENQAIFDALVNYSLGTLAEVHSYEKEGALLSPIDGEISEIFPKVGELVGQGAPIMNIVNLDHMTVIFNVREDLLSQFKIGTTITAFVPALDNAAINLRITHLKDMGTYAAWKATKATGQYDIKTFEVRTRPVEKVEGLRPGMSVILKMENKDRK